MSHTICRGRSAAISDTKSHSPFSCTASITPAARTCTWSRSWLSCFGPNPEFTRLAELLVARVVHVDDRPEELADLLRDVADVRAAPARAEQLGVPADVDDVRVPGERPVPRPLREPLDQQLVVERDRGFVAQELEDRFPLRLGPGPELDVAEVDAAERQAGHRGAGSSGSGRGHDGSVRPCASAWGCRSTTSTMSTSSSPVRRSPRWPPRPRPRASTPCTSPTIPRPTMQWLEGGGHHALEPLVGLAFAAASTTTIKLQTHVYVAAYRNPFLAAKGVATLDALSGGRVLLGVAAGYLRPEFGALGVDFDERNDLLDECIEVMRKVWTEDCGRGTTAATSRPAAVTMRPRPVEHAHPPIWIGGNSDRAMRRAVELGDGWVPFPNPVAAARATKTPSITSRWTSSRSGSTRCPRPRAEGGADRPARRLLRAVRPGRRPGRLRGTRRRRGSRCSSTTSRLAPSGSTGCRGLRPTTRSGGG